MGNFSLVDIPNYDGSIQGSTDCMDPIELQGIHSLGMAFQGMQTSFGLETPHLKKNHCPTKPTSTFHYVP